MRFERRANVIQIALVACICLASFLAVFSFYQYFKSSPTIQLKVVSKSKKIKLIPNTAKSKTYKVDISNAPLNHKTKKPIIIES